MKHAENTEAPHPCCFSGSTLIRCVRGTRDQFLHVVNRASAVVFALHSCVHDAFFQCPVSAWRMQYGHECYCMGSVAMSEAESFNVSVVERDESI